MVGWGWATMALGLAVVVALIVLAVWLVARYEHPRSSVPSESAREILDRRLARGEIDLDAYERAAGALERHRRPAAR